MKRVQEICFLAIILCGCHQKEDSNKPSAEILQLDLDRANIHIKALESQADRLLDAKVKSELLISKLEKEKRQAEDEAQELRGRVEAANARMQAMRELGRAEGELKSLTGSTSVSTNTTSYRSSDYSSSATSTSPADQDAEPLPWKYPSEAEARTIVRQAASAKWGENFKMVEYEITKQMKSHAQLAEYEKKRWSSPLIRRILNKAGEKWGSNFDMVLYEVEGQMDAKSRLKSAP